VLVTRNEFLDSLGTRMKRAASLCVLILASVLSSQACAIHKCVTKEGVVYQDRPCVVGDSSVVQMVVPTFGESSQKSTALVRVRAEAPTKDGELVAVPVSVVAVPPPKQ
jgi:hypothetical protein